MEIIGESGEGKKEKEEEKENNIKQVLYLYSQGMSLGNIAKEVFGDEKKKPLVQLWIKKYNK